MTLPLFESMPASETQPPPAKRDKKAERKRKAKLAYKATSAAWKQATYHFAVSIFLPSHKTFIFEELSTAYEEEVNRHKRPATVEKRAFAGLRAQLIQEGLMAPVPGEFRYRSQGSATQVYQSNLYAGS